MLLQAMDYLRLSQNEGCRLQIGGSDQWGNIVSGIDPDPPAHWRECLWSDASFGNQGRWYEVW